MSSFDSAAQRRCSSHWSRKHGPLRVIEEAESPKTDDPIEMPELRDDDPRLLLEMARCAPDPYRPDDWAGPIMAFCAAFTRLELEGLAQRDGSGRWLTAHGERVADVVARNAEASSPA